MSEKTFSFTECLTVIAYFGFLQSVHQKRTAQSSVQKEVDAFGPPRREKGSYSIKHPDYTLEELLAQIPNDNANSKKAKDAAFGPPRREKGSDSIERPDYTLKDLLAQVEENSSHDEIDTGPPVGNEIW